MFHMQELEIDGTSQFAWKPPSGPVATVRAGILFHVLAWSVEYWTVQVALSSPCVATEMQLTKNSAEVMFDQSAIIQCWPLSPKISVCAAGMFVHVCPADPREKKV